MERISLDLQRERIDELARVIAERRQSEASIRNSCQAREDTINAQFSADRAQLSKRIQAEKHELQSRHTDALEAIARSYEENIERASSAHDEAYREATQLAESERQAARADYERARRTAEQNYKDAVRAASQVLQDSKREIEQDRDQLRHLDVAVDRVLRGRWCARAARQLPALSGSCDSPQPRQRYGRELAAARAARDQFPRQRIPRFVANGGPVAVFVFAWIAAMLLGVALGLGELPWIIASFTVAFGSTLILYIALRQRVVRQTLQVYAQFQGHLANADKALDAARALNVAQADQKRIALRQKRELEIREAAALLQRREDEVNAQREVRLKQAADALQQRRQETAERREREQEEVHRKFEAERRHDHQQHEQLQHALVERKQQDLAASTASYQRSWDRLVLRWNEGLARFRSSVDAMSQFCQERFPAWDRVDWQTWRPAAGALPALRFGHYTISLGMFQGGLSEFDELRPEQTPYSLPAVMSFGERPSLLLETWGEGRHEAGRCMQNVMLRLLTSLPPGKVRFTILDPVGLGQTFSAFMHLADYDEKLVNHRIWTEAGHIQQRLADLTEHIENVIQTYLRNEFRSIDEYNRQAGEVAEPFQILVVANFPAGFSDEAAQRLLSVAGSGARCGVFTLISTDSKLELPRNFSLEDLRAHACTIQWNGEQFRWLDEDVHDLPLVLDEPPDDLRLTEVIRAAGERAQQADRVQVPFATVTSPPQEWWSQDSRGGIEVALGRAGATKLQRLRLGQGTSQHVLISGKTGSGKSTLLHALITNTSIHYAPDEVEFYLIDFKKGVEFKPYAACRLPHARVVAIESEREFGMSVLQRLDLELGRRGDLFRAGGVQDIQNYRDANPATKLPRILLVIDEFQELFVQDDKLAQDAALLLDRLVRQGRAFGIHVLLGSQTLAGAYSLARSTIGQMAVRIALQCSEADAHLILSEDNTAARLLSRPGEAIYNDANGLFEGNHPFQVVWLPAQEHQEHLKRLAELAESRRIEVEPPIVFEGNVPADASQNVALRSALRNVERTETRLPTAWLGAAVAIKEPTAALFRRQSGGNLLIVGQQEELANGLLAHALLSLAATGAVTGTRFYVLDGSRPDAPQAQFWQHLAECLPLNLRLVTPTTSAQVTAEIATEVIRRVDEGDAAADGVFVFVNNLSRFRELRRRDDDFGFSGFGEDQQASLDKQFVRVLRDGPAVGVHTLIWCDTFNNVGRWFDRSTLRDLDQRVLLQMSATDSSNLMDSPAASRLGAHRAILYAEETGQVEKFRPYGPPTEAWLRWVQQQLASHPSSRVALTGDGE